MNLAFRIANDIENVFKASPTLPKDTGNLHDHGLVAVEVNKNKAYVVIGGIVAPYAYWLQFNKYVGRSKVENRHLGFVNKIIYKEVIPLLEVKYNAKRE